MQLAPETYERILAQSRIASAIRALVDDFERHNTTLTIIQVGACNGKIENDHLQEVIKRKEFVRAHLIEAVDWLYDELVEVMKPYEEHIKCYNVAISDKDELRNFYSVARQAGIDEPTRPGWQLFQIGGLLKSNLSPYFPDKYIECKEMRCRSPATFIKEAGLSGQDLNVLVVDAEGLDADIVLGFLEIAQPNLIVYEHKILSEDVHNVVLRALKNKGYRCKKVGEDMLAIR